MEKYVAATLTRQNVDKKPDNFLRECWTVDVSNRMSGDDQAFNAF